MPLMLDLARSGQMNDMRLVRVIRKVHIANENYHTQRVVLQGKKIIGVNHRENSTASSNRRIDRHAWRGIGVPSTATERNG
jgi:hypothetical protein